MDLNTILLKRLNNYTHLAELALSVSRLQKKHAAIVADIETDPQDDERTRLYARAFVIQDKIRDAKHELHCVAVLLGVADHNPERYGEIDEPAPFGVRKVNRRDPFKGSATEIDLSLEIEIKRAELQTELSNQESKRDRGERNTTDLAFRELVAFNREYPINEQQPGANV